MECFPVMTAFSMERVWHTIYALMGEYMGGRQSNVDLVVFVQDLSI